MKIKRMAKKYKKQAEIVISFIVDLVLFVSARTSFYLSDMVENFYVKFPCEIIGYFFMYVFFYKTIKRRLDKK